MKGITFICKCIRWLLFIEYDISRATSVQHKTNFVLQLLVDYVIYFWFRFYFFLSTEKIVRGQGANFADPHKFVEF